MKATRLFLLCLAHFLVDTFAAFLHPIMPDFESRLQLGAMAVGMLTAGNLLAASFSQPLWGYIGDRFSRGHLVIVGPFVALAFIGFVGLTQSYWVLLILVVGSGFGVAAFHPEGAAHAASASGARQSAGMALFVISGHFGLAAGPVLAGWLASRHGLERSWWLIPPGFVLLGIIAVLLHGSRHVHVRRVPLPLRRVWDEHRATVLPLLVLSTLRAFVGIALTFGMPFWWKAIGYDNATTGLLTGLFLFSGGIAGFVCGCIARQGHERRWIAGAFLLTVPCQVWLLSRTELVPMIVGVILLGACLNATIPMVVVLAQRVMAGGESVAASLMLGLSWGLGGALAPPVVRLAQNRFGEAAALQWTLVGLIAAIGVSALLPRPMAPHAEAKATPA